jgi:hypothetical protein
VGKGRRGFDLPLDVTMGEDLPGGLDPDLTLASISEAIVRGQLEVAQDAVYELYCWLQRGGRRPDWGRAAAASAFYLQGAARLREGDVRAGVAR